MLVLARHRSARLCGWNHTLAAERMRQHLASFVVESDFSWLASHGFNAVRIPLGYWNAPAQKACQEASTSPRFHTCPRPQLKALNTSIECSAGPMSMGYLCSWTFTALQAHRMAPIIRDVTMELAEAMASDGVSARQSRGVSPRLRC